MDSEERMAMKAIALGQEGKENMARQGRKMYKGKDSKERMVGRGRKECRGQEGKDSEERKNFLIRRQVGQDSEEGEEESTNLARQLQTYLAQL